MELDHEEITRMILDHDKAISLLVQSNVKIGETLTEIKDTMKEYKDLLKEFYELEKKVMIHDQLKKDVILRLEKLEKSHDSEGCQAMRVMAQKVETLAGDVKGLKEDKNKLFWGLVFTLGTAVAGLLGLHK